MYWGCPNIGEYFDLDGMILVGGCERGEAMAMNGAVGGAAAGMVDGAGSEASQVSQVSEVSEAVDDASAEQADEASAAQIVSIVSQLTAADYERRHEAIEHNFVEATRCRALKIYSHILSNSHILSKILSNCIKFDKLLMNHRQI